MISDEDWKKNTKHYVHIYKTDPAIISDMIRMCFDQNHHAWNPSWLKTAELIFEELDIPGDNLREKLVFFQLLGKNSE